MSSVDFIDLRCALGLACSLLVACAQPSTNGDKDPIDPVADAARTGGCRPAGEVDPLVAFEGPRCEWLLLSDATGLRLRSLDDAAGPDVAGVMPHACLDDRCRFEGVHTEAGPVVIAIERSPASEMPGGLHLGMVAAGHLRFVDLWAGAGEPVESEGTEVGPAFSLSPHVCGPRLALFVEPRFEVAGQGEPPRELAAREGLVTFEGDEAKAEATSRDGCVPLELELL